jgi:hypothetical protein
MTGRATLFLAVSLLLVAALVPASGAAPPPGDAAWLRQMLQIKERYGYLPLHGPEAEGRAAAAALGRSRSMHPELWTSSPGSPAAQGGPTTARVMVGWPGLAQQDLAPPDPITAAGPKSYVQAINSQLGIYSRSGHRIHSATFTSLAGGENLSDPQVLWDVETQRFYFLIWDVDTATMRWGFSKNDHPTRIPRDFCAYNADLGWDPPTLPDYPKLGQTNDYLLVGANVYEPPNGVTFRGADLGWITKPNLTGPITKCPAPSSFKSGHVENLIDCHGGSLVANPEPAKQVDPSSTGWVVANADPTNNGAPADHLNLFEITKGPRGIPSIPLIGTCVRIRQYLAPPAPAPQRGFPTLIDTLDGRLTSAVSAYDPLRGGTALWTQHTVFGGAGAAVHWYEIDVANAVTYQQGEIRSSREFVYNASLSPDRVIPAAKGPRFYGPNFVVGFTASSPFELPVIKMVSKRGNGDLSDMVAVRPSTGPDAGFDCFQSVPVLPLRCRWGDYAGASPDPGSSTSARAGNILLSNQLANGDISPVGSSAWGTWNWVARP